MAGAVALAVLGLSASPVDGEADPLTTPGSAGIAAASSLVPPTTVTLAVSDATAASGPSSVAVATSTTAPAPTTAPASVAPTTTLTPPTPERVGASALDLVRYDWRDRFGDWEIVFQGPRSGLRALTYPKERRVEIFVRTSDTAASVHRVLAHEIGHIVDVELNSDADRDRWRAQRGLGERISWWPSASDPDFATGAGDFAEAFAVWETGVVSQSTVAGQPTAADLTVLAELVADR